MIKLYSLYPLSVIILLQKIVLIFFFFVYILTDKSDDFGQRKSSGTHHSKSQSQMPYNLRKRTRNKDWGKLLSFIFMYINLYVVVNIVVSSTHKFVDNDSVN